MGIIMSNLGRFPGSSLLQILTSRAMWEEIPGGSDNRRPSMAIFSIDFIFKIQNYTIKQISYYCWWYVLFLFLHIDNAWNIYLTQVRNIFFFKYQWFQYVSYSSNYPVLTFIPVSMGDNSACGTSLVSSSHSSTAKLHMSAAFRLMSSGRLWRAEIMQPNTVVHVS